MMAARDRLERVAAWFGFGDIEDEYYYEEEEERNAPYGRTAYAGNTYAGNAYAGGGEEPAPAVRRLGRAGRSSAFGTSLGDLFGSDGADDYERESDTGQPHLRPVPDPRPAAG